MCSWISVFVFFSFRWWQFRRRPSHHPFRKAWICIQLWASTNVSIYSQPSRQGSAAYLPGLNFCCGWRGNLFNGSRNCTPTCSRELIISLNWRGCFYTDIPILFVLFFFFFNFHKKGAHCCPVAYFLFTKSYGITTYSSLLRLPKRRERNLNCHWSTAEWLWYLLIQPTGTMQTSRTRDKSTVGKKTFCSKRQVGIIKNFKVTENMAVLCE